MNSHQTTKTMDRILVAAFVLLALVGTGRQVASAPLDGDQDSSELSEQDDMASLDMAGSGRRQQQQQPRGDSADSDEFGPTGSGGNFNNDMGQQQYDNFARQPSYGQQQQQQQQYQQQQQAEASENNENNAEDNEDDDNDADLVDIGAHSSGAASSNAHLRPWQAASGSSGDELEASLSGADSNIANAKIELTPNDMATAAGHHHHHGHYAHGWLKMGAETGKKGAFKWHDKHPVGGKGRR